MSSVMRNKVQRKFKMRGYTLKMEALSEILGFLSRFPEAEDEALDLLLDELHHLSLKSSILDKEPVHKVVSLLLEAEAAVEESPTSSGYGLMPLISPNLDMIQSRNYFTTTKHIFIAMAKLFSKSRCSTRMVKGLHRFTLEKYSSCKGIGFGNSIDSGVFSVGGHQWAILFFPEGIQCAIEDDYYQELCREHIGFGVKLLSESNGVRYLLNITLLDQSGKGKHHLFDNYSRLMEPITHRVTVFPLFIERVDLEKSSYLKDDCLKFEWTIDVVLPYETETMAGVTKSVDVGIDFFTLLETGKFSDIILNVAGNKFRAHKAILSSRSSVFKSIFASKSFSSPEIVITGVEPRVFKALLHFLYTDKLPENEESFVSGYAFGPSVFTTLAAKLLAAAHAYDIRRLKYICESHLWRSISLSRFADTISVADMYNTCDLKHLCFNYAAHNYDALMELGSFTYLQKNYQVLFDEVSDYLSKENRLVKKKPAFTCQRSAWLSSTKELRPISKLEDEASESASLTVMRMERATHECLVKNYSLYKGIGVNKAYESKSFTVGGYQWMLCFYPGGMDDDANENGNASITVLLKSKTSSDVRCVVKICILDQYGKGNHYGPSLVKEYPTKHHILRYGHRVVFRHFIKRASLINSTYLRDDCLKIGCNIGVLTIDIQEFPVLEVPVSTMGTDLGNLFSSKEGADVFFLVANERFCAHKYILATRFPSFWSRFSDHHQDQEMVILDIEPKVFKAILWFIYTGEFLEEEPETTLDSGSFILTSFVGKMLAASHQFALKNLKEICESHILKRLSIESVAYTLHLADLYHATELKAACLKFAAENKAAFMETEGSEYLKETCPLLFLEVVSYEKNLSTERGMDILADIKEYIVGWYRRWSTDSNTLKRKDL